MAIFFSSVMFLGVIESCKICKHKVESPWFSWFFGLRWPMEAGSRSERNVGKPWEADLLFCQANASGASEAANVLREISRDFAHFVWLTNFTCGGGGDATIIQQFQPGFQLRPECSHDMLRFAWRFTAIAYQSWTSKRFRGRFHQGSAQFRRHFEHMSFKKCGVELSGVSTSWDTLWAFAPFVALGYMENSCSKQL